MRVELLDCALDPWAQLARYQQEYLVDSTAFGATASFVGTMRDFNQGDRVQAMWLEHYPGMTEKSLESIGREAVERWQLLDALIVHRVGHITPGEPIVLLAVWAAHRAEAFEACRYLIEELKTRAPFWKKETLDDGERWVRQ